MNYSENPYTKLLHKHPHQECTRCVMNTSDPWITFDGEGLCSHCKAYDIYIARAGSELEKAVALERMVNHLRARGRGKSYDCIMGLSGGVDSSYLAWLAVNKLGLRPLIVHVDAGWNSELAVNNIQNIVQKLGLDMHTLVINWPEIRDLQQAYFRSGIANLDVPQDHAFVASLYKEAKKFGIKDILNGGNMQTESVLPEAWGYDASDARSLFSIHRRYGKLKLKSFPTISNFERFIYYPYIARMIVHRPLEWIDYRKDDAKRLLEEQLGWRDYGGKHFESVFTKFFQAHYLPVKFGYDKRLAHYSSLIVSGQITKDQAKRDLQMPLYQPDELIEDRMFWIKKLDITEEEYNLVMSGPPSTYMDYDNSVRYQRNLKKIARVLRYFLSLVPRSHREK